ncbi:hypothetical protein ACRXCV_12065 [Halobacteriovorax sp. GFR7]|uniref:hypothetical protein n=1 Tax=unclassified Halobacteriovorax TaxID=2639665 RepID=UPI003D98E5BB
MDIKEIVTKVPQKTLEKALYLYSTISNSLLLRLERNIFEFCIYLAFLDEKIQTNETIELESLIHYKYIQQNLKEVKGHRKTFLANLVSRGHFKIKVNRKLLLFKKVDYLIQNIGEVKVESDIILEFINAIKNNEPINNQYSKYLYDYYRYNILDDTDFADWTDTTFVD